MPNNRKMDSTNEHDIELSTLQSIIRRPGGLLMIRQFCFITLTITLFCLLAPHYSFADGDPCVYQSSYTDSEGNRGTYITNRDAKNLDKYIHYTGSSGYTYKNYNRLGPSLTKTLQAPQSATPCTLKSPYGHLDGTFTANSGRALESIIVTYGGAPGGQVDISPIIIREGMRYNVDPLLIKTVIKYESGFCASAMSPAGAAGLMQLMPGTAEVLGVSDVFSPYQNISGGVQYIRRQLDNFGGNVALALAAYNAGPGAVIEYGGIPPFSETQNYVYLIISDYVSSGKVAKRKGGSTFSPSNVARDRQIDVISTLSKMKSGTQTSEATSSSSSPVTQQPASPQIVPLPTGSSSTTQNLLENRSSMQGNPLENNPTKNVPGY